MVASSEGQLAAHVEGKRHRKHVAMAEVLGVAKTGAAEEAAEGDGDEALRCDLCNVTAPSLTHKQLHLMCACPPLSPLSLDFAGRRMCLACRCLPALHSSLAPHASQWARFSIDTVKSL